MKLTAQRVRSLVEFNPTTGLFFWRYRKPEDCGDGIRTKEMRCRIFNSRYAGRRAFTAINGHGYYSAVIDGHRTSAHRIAWLYHYGKIPDVIDHINGDKLDNRICNLRNVTKHENSKNASLSRRNNSGLVGVRYETNRKRWAVDIRHDRKLYYLGRFKCLAHAVKARKKAEQEFGFHENHGRRS